MHLSTELTHFNEELPIPSIYQAIDAYRSSHLRGLPRYIFLSHSSSMMLQDAIKPYMMKLSKHDDTLIAVFSGHYIIVLPDLPDEIVMIGGLTE